MVCKATEVNILWVPLRFVSGENHIIAQENLVLRFMETVIISRIRLTSLIHVKDKIFLWFKLSLISLNVTVIKACD